MKSKTREKITKSVFSLFISLGLLSVALPVLFLEPISIEQAMESIRTFMEDPNLQLEYLGTETDEETYRGWIGSTGELF